MAEGNILAAIEKLGGGSQKAHNEGLQVIQRVFGRRPDLSVIEDPDDLAFHKVFDTLFRIVRNARSAVLKASSAGAKTIASSSLTVAANALRLIIEAGRAKLKLKTATAVLDHIATLLSDEDGDVRQLVQNDYLKSFRLVVEVPAHLEHLRPKQWKAYVQLALEVLASSGDDQNGHGQSAQSLESFPQSEHHSLRTSQKSTGRNTKRDGVVHLDEVSIALSYLAGTPNSPVLSMAHEISDTVLDFLSHGRKATEVTLATSFEILNHLLLLALTEDVLLAQKIFIRAAPCIRRHWAARSTSLREKMTITLLYCRPLMLARDGSFPTIQIATTEPLFDTLLAEYSERDLGDQLQMEDVKLSAKSSAFPLKLDSLEPRFDSTRSMACWSVLTVLACLSLSLASHERQDLEPNAPGSSNKRRKLETSLDMLLQRASSSSGSEKLAALQILLFTFDQPVSTPRMFLDQLTVLTSQLSDGESRFKSWTCLIFSRLACCSNTQLESFRDRWSGLSELARKLASIPSVSRAACKLLNSLHQHRLMEMGNQADQFLALFGNSNESISMTDTAMEFLITLLTSGLENTAIQRDLSLKALDWLSSRWVLPVVVDRVGNAHLALNSPPEIIFRLLCAANGERIALPLPDIDFSTNPLYQASIRLANHEVFTRFMLDIPQTIPSGDFQTADDTTIVLKLIGTTSIQITVLEMLITKSKAFLESWEALIAERESNISADVMEIVTSLCVISCAFTDKFAKTSKQLTQLAEVTAVLWKNVCAMARDQDQKSQGLFTTIVLQRALQLNERHGSAYEGHLSSSGRRLLIAPLLELCEDALHSQKPHDIFDDEFSDTKESWNSQSNHSSLSNSSSMTIRRADTFISEYRNFIVACRIESQLEQALVTQTSDRSDTSSLQALERVLHLTSDELIAARAVLISHFKHDIGLSRASVARLLHHLADNCLQKDQFDRSEPALVLCLRISSIFIRLWTNGEEDALAEVAFDIYNFAITASINVKKAVVSSEVVIALVDMLDMIMQTNATYGTEDLPSPRTSLLQILGTSVNRVKYYLARKVSGLFNRYVLDQHAAILEDVMENLPKTLDDPQAIAIRLFLLSELGSRWHTILRQTVYHVFETAAHVSTMSQLAKRCLQRICEQTGIQSCRHLFQLFAPQILYTWLGQDLISSIPAAAFDYDSLTILVTENLVELVSQIALRGSDELADELCRLCGNSWDHLLRSAICRAESYTLASETSLAPKDRLFDGSEPKIRKQLGSQVHTQLLRDRYPEILANLLLILQDDKGIDRSFEKSEYHQELSSWTAMCELAKSTIQMPLSQQPSFRARYLIDECLYLHSRTGLNRASSMSSATLIYVYRSLLNNLTPSLGPLHACSILRKLRIALCLGGSVALRGYPLEMLLHNLRPYITVFHCSEDAIGLFWFLLDRGKDYVRDRLSFVAGLCLSIFTALTGFLSSSQDSTTQEVHFISTMSHAQEFRTWLGEFLLDLTSKDDSSEKTALFRHVVTFAQSMTRSGNNSRSSPEAKLLCCLLQDQASHDPLLTLRDFDQALTILTANFEMTESPFQDILDNDVLVTSLAPVLQGVLQRMPFHKSFQSWAGYVIGKAYICNGEIADGGLTQDKAKLKLSLFDTNVPELTSYRRIIECLSSKIWSVEHQAAAAIEATLQAIATTLTKADQADIFGTDSDEYFLNDLRFEEFGSPRLHLQLGVEDVKDIFENLRKERSDERWAAQLVIALCLSVSEDPILSFLPFLMTSEPSLGPLLLPYVVHLALHTEIDTKRHSAEKLSTLFSEILQDRSEQRLAVCRSIISAVLYLRSCILPTEKNMAQRNGWLDINFANLATTASHCKMWQTALFFAELYQSQMSLTSGRSSRKSFSAQEPLPASILLDIYQNVNDSDFFYGGQRDTSLQSLLQKLDHEQNYESILSFQSALLDSSLRSCQSEVVSMGAAKEMVTTLQNTNFLAISSAVASYAKHKDVPRITTDEMSVFMDMQRWELVGNRHDSIDSKWLVESLMTIATSTDREIALRLVDEGLGGLIQTVFAPNIHNQQLYRSIGDVAAFAELRQFLSLQSPEDMSEGLHAVISKTTWGRHLGFETIQAQLAARETLFGILQRNEALRSSCGLNRPQAILLEIQSIRESLRIGRSQDRSQYCLSRVIQLLNMVDSAASLGIKVDASVKLDFSATLWTRNEISSCIHILAGLGTQHDLSQQAINISRSEILIELGQKVAEARLDTPDEIVSKYLLPALKDLRGSVTGSDAGRVYHAFANFCDLQLQDTDHLDDLARITKIRDRKAKELQDLEKMIKESEGQTREKFKEYYKKTRIWFKLDDAEWRRIHENRDSLVLQCLDNYLLSMRACEDFTNDVLRFVALWLDQTGNTKVNAIVRRHLVSIPSIKFAPLMNQLSSRILDNKDEFQQILLELMFRICCEHPYHSLNQIFATSKTKPAKNDDVAISRCAAAGKLAELIRTKGSAGPVWVAVHNSNLLFWKLALEKSSDKEMKTGTKMLLKKLVAGQKLEQMINDTHTRIPPPTAHIPLRIDHDYSSVPSLSRFEPQLSVAGGISAPKVLTVIASDGKGHKMLVKGGNDDLRQDSIMEQVFEQVSNLLKDHRATRQRRLGIRTYKVIPLSSNAGIIEFVQGTIPLHDFLLPAHTRYYPKDIKPKDCRAEISRTQTASLTERVQAYRDVTSRFHPVMRFFFMEHFLDPDVWFQKRLNYSQSTAAISILGHVLGLGDRHGHNILLDENSGEVVHIDLGVAFEAGRVLPVPEVVPFRLTRDLVDGMGLSGVEGVFRRCCNFTLEALRADQETIMTILDVLRYDPLYSWSLSPLRLQKMQDNKVQATNGNASTSMVGETSDATTTAAEAQNTTATTGTGGKKTTLPSRPATKLSIDEPSEADRALTVVAKKLGKSLSVEATVNELIRQATDEKNLAVLYCGWAAYV